MYKKETYENRLYIIHLFHIAHDTSCQEKKRLHNYCFQSLLIITVVSVKKKKTNQPVPVVQVNKKRTIRQCLCKFFLGEAKFNVGCVNGELGRELGGS